MKQADQNGSMNQLNLMTQNRFDALSKDRNVRLFVKQLKRDKQ